LLFSTISRSSLLDFTNDVKHIRQAMRFQSFRHAQNRALGIPAREGTKAMADLQANLGSGAVVICPG